MTKRLLALCSGIAVALCVSAPSASAQAQGMQFQGGYYDDENFEDDWFFDYYDVDEGTPGSDFSRSGDYSAYEDTRSSNMLGRQFLGAMQGRGTDGGAYGSPDRWESSTRGGRDYAERGMRSGDYGRTYGQDYGDARERDTRSFRDYADRSDRGSTYGDTRDREDRGWRDYASDDMSERRSRGTDYGYDYYGYDYDDQRDRRSQGSPNYAERGSMYGDTWNRGTQGSRDYAERSGRSSTYSDTWNRPDRSGTRTDYEGRNMASDDWYSEGFDDEGTSRSRDLASEDDWTDRTGSNTWRDNRNDGSNF